MAKDKKEKKKSQKEINIENLNAGINMLHNHPLFGELRYIIFYSKQSTLGKGSYCNVDSDGNIYVNENEYLSPRAWSYVIAHCILHPAFGHFDADVMPGYIITDANGIKHKKVECIPEIWNIPRMLKASVIFCNKKGTGSLLESLFPHHSISTHYDKFLHYL